jgi:hypothetical protein
MVRKLNPDDFRAARRVLEPDDFALSDENPDPPPTDLIAESAWQGITDLPGDVAIRTTSHQGSRVGLLHELCSAWTETFPESGMVGDGMLNAFDCFQASLFNLVHGFYKEAIFALRSAIETITLATSCQLANDEETWTKWRAGDELSFKRRCDRAQKLPPFDTLEQRAREITGTSIFAGDDGSGRNAWARNLYRRLCEYAHARGNATNAELWQSNGPIYSARGFALSYHTFLETYALCLILTKIAEPALTPEGAALDILDPENLTLYLDAQFRRTCEFYADELFKPFMNREPKITAS